MSSSPEIPEPAPEPSDETAPPQEGAAKLQEHETPDARYRHRPRPIRWANALGRIPLVGPRLDPERLISRVQKKTGRTLRGFETLVARLEPLCSALEAEASLNLIGRYLARQRIELSLNQRAHWEHWFLQQGSKISTRKLGPPIYILGMPRTGTTLVQRLFSAEPRVRSLFSWEAQRPAPEPDQPRAATRDDDRFKWAERQHRILEYLCPEMKVIHESAPALPEEDGVLLDHSLFMQSMTSLAHIPSYQAWLTEQDFTSVYELEGRLLQLLMWQRPGSPNRWVLQSPMHMYRLSSLLKVFPDATIVWTHRDPMEVLPSHCRLVAHLRGMMTDTLDLSEVGRFLSEDLPRGVGHAMSQLDQVGLATRARVVDVHYEELLAEPIPQMKRIYEASELPWSLETEGKMRGHLAQARHHKHGKHEYSLSEFGLSEAAIRAAFASYMERFSIRREGS